MIWFIGVIEKLIIWGWF